MSTQPSPQISPEHIFFTLNAFQQSYALKGAIELELFTHRLRLDQYPRDRELTGEAAGDRVLDADALHYCRVSIPAPSRRDRDGARQSDTNYFSTDITLPVVSPAEEPTVITTVRFFPSSSAETIPPWSPLETVVT